jgi:hypothetical protein
LFKYLGFHVSVLVHYEELEANSAHSFGAVRSFETDSGSINKLNLKIINMTTTDNFMPEIEKGGPHDVSGLSLSRCDVKYMASVRL